MSLLSSAKVFLIESLGNYANNQLTFAILHAMIAVELFLKERLILIDERLIYEKDKSGEIKRNYTVNLSAIPGILSANGIVLDEGEKTLITTLSIWRNHIVHHVPSHDNQEAKAHLRQLYTFIINFSNSQFAPGIKDFLPEEDYKRMVEDVDEMREEADKAREIAENSGRVDSQNICSGCCEYRVVQIVDENDGYCHLCSKAVYRPICSANDCENILDIYVADTSYDRYCDNCVNVAGELYLEQLIDQRRGK